MLINFRLIFILILTIAHSSCKSSATIAEIDQLKKVVTSKNFTIVANSANPMGFVNTRGLENLLPPGSNLSNINLINNPNSIIVKSDSLLVDLPYFGELRVLSGYNTTNNGIHFKGIPESSKIIFNTKNNFYQINYTLQLQNENLQLSITLFASNRASFNINSTNRTTINYQGVWEIPK